MTPHELPAWVRKRDGRLVPFEADKISQALFAATEVLGSPNAFLARELTDGILHFLQQEAASANPTTGQIADLAVKVTRELGYPDVAAAFERRRAASGGAGPKAPHVHQVAFSPESPLPLFLAWATRQYVRKVVYTRDLVAAMQEGLLHGCLRGRPDTIEALAVEPAGAETPIEDAILDRMLEVRPCVRRFIVDGPDSWVERPHVWLGKLDILLRAVRKRAILNLHVATPPLWAEEASAGPLFGAPATRPPLARRTQAFLDAYAAFASRDRRISLHLHADAASSRDAATFTNVPPGTIWTFDRPDRPITLGPGVRRGQPACLMEIGLGLTTLLRLPAVNNNVDRFLEKLPSLAGMAISAAVQKRAFLARRLPRDAFLLHGFLLHRARARLTPLGLEETVRLLVGQLPDESAAARDLARLIVHTLHDSAARQGRQRNIEPVLTLDWPEQSRANAADAVLATADALARAGAEVTAHLPSAVWSMDRLEMSRKTALERITFRAVTL
ncbi:MAG: ATP cone domain-containing protein [Gemmataceae bacterium]